MTLAGAIDTLATVGSAARLISQPAVPEREGATMAAAGTFLRAGAAKVDITPPLGTPMVGSFQERRAAAVDDPLYARAAVLERGYLRLALVACDIISLPADDVARTLALIAERTRPAHPAPPHLRPRNAPPRGATA